MKKNLFVICMFFVVFLTSCSTTFDYDGSKQKLLDNGWIRCMEELSNEEMTASLNSEIKYNGYDFTVMVIDWYEINPAESTTTNFITCLFLTFATKEENHSFTQYYIERHTSKWKIASSDNRCITTNSEEAISLLGLSFKSGTFEF